jgi:hypothetical protein
MPWHLLTHPAFQGLLGGTLVALTLWLTATAYRRRRANRTSGCLYFAPDGACWFGADLTPSTDAENSRT